MTNCLTGQPAKHFRTPTPLPGRWRQIPSPDSAGLRGLFIPRDISAHSASTMQNTACVESSTPSLPRLGAGRGGSINACRRYRDICSPLGVSWQFDKFLDAASSAVDGCSCRHCCVGWSAASIVSKQQLLVPVAWLVRLRRLGQEAHDPYPSLVGVAEGHAWRLVPLWHGSAIWAAEWASTTT